jgi:hypothetical protein
MSNAFECSFLKVSSSTMHADSCCLLLILAVDMYLSLTKAYPSPLSIDCTNLGLSSLLRIKTNVLNTCFLLRRYPLLLPNVVENSVECSHHQYLIRSSRHEKVSTAACATKFSRCCVPRCYKVIQYGLRSPLRLEAQLSCACCCVVL